MDAKHTQVQRIVRRLLEDLNLQISPADDQDLRDAGLTSLQLVDLVFLVEDECGLSLPEKEINPANFKSIATISNMVARLTVRDGKTLAD